MNITTKRSTGVLGKDGLPFAPRCMFFNDGAWKTPVNYSPDNLLIGLLNEEVLEIEMITEDNVQYNIFIER